MFITATLRVPQDVNRLKLLSEIFPDDNRVHLIPFFSSDTVWGSLPFDSVWQGFITIGNHESHRLSSGMPNKSVASVVAAYCSLANATKAYIAANNGSDMPKASQVQGS